MVNAAWRAVAELFNPALRGVLLRALAITVAALGALGALLYALVAALSHGWSGWLHRAVEILAGLGLVAGSILLIPTVAILVVTLFLDEVADVVEARHYPDAPRGKPLALGPALSTGARFAAVALALNLLALPLYFLPGPNLLVYLALNGYLTGREYFELVALRHIAPKDASVLRRRHKIAIYGAGVLIALAFAVPILNLLAPLFGAALMVHVFKHVESPPDPRT